MKTEVAFWRRTPPALFPPLLGLFGLGVAWQKAGGAMVWAQGIGDAIIGMCSLLFLIAIVPFAMKFLVRPSVLSEELRVIPARAGVAASSMAMMVMAAGLYGIWPVMAGMIWYFGLALHTVFFASVLLALYRGPSEQRKLSPVQHLPFVGFIVAPLAGMSMGYSGLSASIFWISLGIAAIIWVGSGSGLLGKPVPAPLRPLQAIHLAPVAILGLVANSLGYAQLFTGFVYGSLVIGLVLLVRIRWITEAGFSPLWGAFTFPVAAFASLQFTAYGAGMGDWALYVAFAALALASISNPWIAAQVFRAWAKGALAVKTNAAVA